MTDWFLRDPDGRLWRDESPLWWAEWYAETNPGWAVVWLPLDEAVA